MINISNDTPNFSTENSRSLNKPIQNIRLRVAAGENCVVACKCLAKPDTFARVHHSESDDDE